MLSDKQKRFCDEYLIDLNATQAAIRAGYSKKTARQKGHYLLTLQPVQERLRERMNQKESEAIATQDEILRFLTDVMRGNVTEELLSNRGDVVELSAGVAAREKAADLLGKRYGMWTERQEVTADLDLNVSIDYGDDAE